MKEWKMSGRQVFERLEVIYVAIQCKSVSTETVAAKAHTLQASFAVFARRSDF
jgi:hypothetical protein